MYNSQLLHFSIRHAIYLSIHLSMFTYSATLVDITIKCWDSSSVSQCRLPVTLYFTSREHMYYRKTVLHIVPLQTGTLCKNTWKQTDAMRFEYHGCRTLREFRPKFCSTCDPRQCCQPDKTKTMSVRWQCENGGSVVHEFMWIKSCLCTYDCPELLKWYHLFMHVSCDVLSSSFFTFPKLATGNYE